MSADVLVPEPDHQDVVHGIRRLFDVDVDAVALHATNEGFDLVDQAFGISVVNESGWELVERAVWAEGRCGGKVRR
jgi:hypothetical protein